MENKNIFKTCSSYKRDLGQLSDQCKAESIECLNVLWRTEAKLGLISSLFKSRKKKQDYHFITLILQWPYVCLLIMKLLKNRHKLCTMLRKFTNKKWELEVGLFLINKSCIYHKFGMFWRTGIKCHLIRFATWNANTGIFLKCSTKLAEGWVFDSRIISYRRKLELNLPGVWPGKSDRQIEREFCCCGQEKKSVLHMEKLHRSCATLLKQEFIF